MTTELATRQHEADNSLIEQVIVGGDLEKLSPAQRTAYYARVCESLTLNPFTRPFEYIRLSGKLVLYATRTATDQLAKKASLSLRPVRTEHIDDVYLVTAEASDPSGRTVTNVGAVEITNLKGAPLANAIMKAHTKAYRRATLSFCGLGWLDETEIETIRDAMPVAVTGDGRIMEPERKPEPVKLAVTLAGPPSPRRATAPTDEDVSDLSHWLKWAYRVSGIKRQADICALIGVPNVLAIQDFATAAEVLLANLPPAKSEHKEEKE